MFIFIKTLNTCVNVAIDYQLPITYYRIFIKEILDCHQLFSLHLFLL